MAASVPLLAGVRCWCWWVLATAAIAQGDPAPAQQTGTWFVVHVHGGSDALAKKALDAAERTWPLVAAALGVPPASPKQPLALHLYRTIAGYEAAEQALTGGAFRRDLAMTHTASHAAHLVLQPPLDEAALAVVGLPAFGIEVLAQQAAQLARLELGPNAAQHPAWFSTGLALQIGREVRESLFPCGGADLAPTASNDVAIAQRLLGQKKLPPMARLLADTLDDLVLDERSAVLAVFSRFLHSDANRGKFAKIAEALATAPAGEGYGKAVQTAVAKLLGATADRDFAAFVQKGRPKWQEPYRSLSTSGRDWHQIAFPNRNAVAWSQEPVKGGKLFAGGTLRILAGGKQQLNFLFARNEAQEFYFIGFVAGEGLQVWRYDNGLDDFREIGKVAVPALRLDAAVPFAIEASGSELLVRVAAQTAKFALPVPLPKDVVWGLGAQAGRQDAATGSAGIWSDVVVGAKKK